MSFLRFIANYPGLIGAACSFYSTLAPPILPYFNRSTCSTGDFSCRLDILQGLSSGIIDSSGRTSLQDVVEACPGMNPGVLDHDVVFEGGLADEVFADAVFTRDGVFRVHP